MSRSHWFCTQNHKVTNCFTVLRKLLSRRKLKRRESRIGNLEEANRNWKHFVCLTEFLFELRIATSKFTIDLLWLCNFVLAGIIYRPRKLGVKRYYVKSSLKLYHSMVNNLKGSRMGASTFIKGVIDLIFSQFLASLVMHSHTRTCSVQCSFSSMRLLYRCFKWIVDTNKNHFSVYILHLSYRR